VYQQCSGGVIQGDIYDCSVYSCLSTLLAPSRVRGKIWV
jgi:hypothetical protein